MSGPQLINQLLPILSALQQMLEEFQVEPPVFTKAVNILSDTDLLENDSPIPAVGKGFYLCEPALSTRCCQSLVGACTICSGIFGIL